MYGDVSRRCEMCKSRWAECRLKTATLQPPAYGSRPATEVVADGLACTESELLPSIVFDLDPSSIATHDHRLVYVSGPGFPLIFWIMQTNGLSQIDS